MTPWTRPLWVENTWRVGLDVQGAAGRPYVSGSPVQRDVPRFGLSRAAIVVAVTWLLTACQSTTADVGNSVSSFTDIEHEWAQSKASWIDADLTLLSKTCRNISPSLRTRLGAAHRVESLSVYDDRKATCETLSQWRAAMSDLRQRGSSATSGDEFEQVANALGELRDKTDAAVQNFPSAEFHEANFSPSASTQYRAKHEAAASDGGRLAAEAVSISRDASGAAMKVANASDHELDKARARLADETYTRSSAQLAALASLSSASEVVSHVDEILSTVDGAIGSAQGTGQVGSNPVTAARESLPSAPATLAPIAHPVRDEAVSSAANEPATANVAPAVVNDTSQFIELVTNTRQLTVVGGSAGCEAPASMEIRFKDDGSGGCADLNKASRASLNSGANIALIPVDTANRGTVFALLYVYKDNGPVFVGILPGDGSGNLSARVEDGVIVEQNGASVKRSTYRGGRVVPA